MNIKEEFHHQVETLLGKGYPKLSGMSSDLFLKRTQELEKKLGTIPNITFDLEKGVLPFVIVIKHTVVDMEKAVSLTQREGKQSYTNMDPHIPSEFETVKEISLPESDMYLLIDIDRGRDTLNIPPSEALPLLLQQNRSPLTIDEGVAILTHYPQFLQKNNCFSLLGSRMHGNKRVPALWITQGKVVRLGWCWDGNPHTWLGSASCAARVG